MSEALYYQDPERLVQRYIESPDPGLKDLIMVQYGTMVERLARKFSGIEPHEDLVQVGYIGLLNALSKFDPVVGVRFTTFATHLVVGEIKHYLRDRAQTIRVPAWLQELRHKVLRAANQIQAREGRPASFGTIADELGISEAAVREVYQAQELLKIASLDSVVTSEEDDGGESESMDPPDPSVEHLSVEDRVVLENAIHQLRDLEREVLVRFHFDAMSQTEIAHELGISCNYVSHILRQSLAKLRRILTTEEEQERLLRRQASALEDGVLDPISGAYNEGYLNRRLHEELHRSASSGSPVALLLMEFTGLESLASFYGEASVRDFLADAADVLRQNTRRLDVVCRWGEHGFAILMPSTGPTGSVVQQRIEKVFGTWVSAHRRPDNSVRAHIGLAVFPQDGRSVDNLMEAARPKVIEARTGMRAAATPEERRAA